MLVHRTTCRACAGSHLRAFLSLGPTPLANAFLKSPAEFADEQFYPLDIFFCEDCSLVQLLDVVDPGLLFRNYIYVTGTSDTIAAHNQEYAQTLVGLLAIRTGDLVVEIASNDGSLLKCFRPTGARTLGIEPATNIAAMAAAQGIETLNEFFNLQTAQRAKYQYGGAKAVVANNVLAHVDEPSDFLCGCKELLAPDGLVVVEVPYLAELIDRMEYDTIYHEHLCYFSLNALIRLYDSAGLFIIRVDRVPVHGGSIRLYAGHRERYGDHAPEVRQLAEQEQRAGLTQLARYEKFANDVHDNRKAVLELLESLRREGKSLAAYGAPAKGSTLLNFLGVGCDLIPYAVDKSKLKIGHYMPGIHIPVLPASTLLEHQPDYVLILAWNFAEEVLQQQREFRSRGGKFIIPIPSPHIR